MSFSDPVPRRAIDERVIFAGHLGTIYQAHNATYIDRSRPTTLRLLPDANERKIAAAEALRASLLENPTVEASVD